jgi:hypothetical protein
MACAWREHPKNRSVPSFELVAPTPRQAIVIGFLIDAFLDAETVAICKRVIGPLARDRATMRPVWREGAGVACCGYKRRLRKVAAAAMKQHCAHRQKKQSASTNAYIIKSMPRTRRHHALSIPRLSIAIAYGPEEIVNRCERSKRENRSRAASSETAMKMH